MATKRDMARKLRVERKVAWLLSKLPRWREQERAKGQTSVCVFAVTLSSAGEAGLKFWREVAERLLELVDGWTTGGQLGKEKAVGVSCPVSLGQD